MPYNCAQCGEVLKPDHWVYSTHTMNRYCFPGEGCWLSEEREKRERQIPEKAIQKNPHRTTARSPVLPELSKPFLPALET